MYAQFLDISFLYWFSDLDKSISAKEGYKKVENAMME